MKFTSCNSAIFQEENPTKNPKRNSPITNEPQQAYRHKHKQKHKQQKTMSYDIEIDHRKTNTS
jgi:hypothetical protein